MADYTDTPQRGHAPHWHPENAASHGNSVTRLTNLTGALVSLALVVGVAVWGYKLFVRDVSGIPVVRAVAGDMRVRPEEPGGQLARHQGLSVNTVTALGASEKRAEELRLAPRPVDLADEDQPMPQITQAVSAADRAPEAVQKPGAPGAQDIAAALESGNVDNLVAQMTNGIAPMENLTGESAPVLASVVTQTGAEVLTGEGMRVSLRPSLRPQGHAVSPAGTPAAANAGLDLESASLPTGTRLVQLGAFDTPEIARAQWDGLAARFAPFMEGKQRIVMEAKSGGRTFYRLRAHGFADIGDARRFCSALVAESVDCIPVVTR
jgi:hypothetical protein